MTVVRSFDRHKFNLPAQAGGSGPLAQGAGIGDALKGAVDFVTQNKQTLAEVGKAASSVASASGKISEAVKVANRFH